MHGLTWAVAQESAELRGGAWGVLEGSLGFERNGLKKIIYVFTTKICNLYPF